MSAVPPEREPSPGLQVERTGLSWERTAFSALATALLLATRVQPPAPPTALLPAAAALALALVLAVIGRRRMRACELRVRPVPGTVLLAGGATAALGVLVMVLALGAP